MMFSSRLPGAASLAISFLTTLSPAVLAHHHSQRDAQCKCFPGDECWPSTDKWSSFNETLGGKLIATVPLAAVCHDSQNTHPDWPAYDEAACTALQQRWIDPSLHYPDSSSTMSPPFVNSSCNLFAPRSADCVVGTYVSYSIRVEGASDISAGIKFANDNNIRLIIRNTGHDFNGKSTGPGTLSLWTHNMKDIEFKDWSDKHYTGKAVKMGAGVQGFEINKAAFDKGMQVVTGSCPTVGVAGGYSQGGGHSALTSLHGMAADQVLEWEVVTASGDHVFANRQQNPDLYWALSGGGGGTYGVVLSMTSKAHQDTPTAGANLTFTTAGLTQEAFYSLIDEFQTTVLPESTKAGVTTTFYVTNTTFSMRPMTGPGLTSTQLRNFVSPFMKKLDAAGVRYASFFGDFGSYTEFYSHMYQALPVNSYVYTGRLLPKDVVLHHGQDVVDAYRFLNEHGAIAIGIGLNAKPETKDVPFNSVNPGWREAMVSLLVVVPWSYKIPLESMQDRLEMITDELTPRLSQITPGGTTYLSEGDFRDPDWKKNFYGVNYHKLEQIKDHWDPEHVFYAPTAVGADYWQPQSDGRLCRA